MLTKGNFTRDEWDHHEFLDVFLQPFYFKIESRVSRPRDLGNARLKKVRQWRNREMFHRAPRIWCETTTKTQQHILESGDKMTLYLRAQGNWCRVVNLQAQRASGNWSKGQGWNSTICKSPTIDTLKKSSRTCGKS